MATNQSSDPLGEPLMFLSAGADLLLPHSRWVFVHMEKCAGQSINRWLTQSLGTAWVTPNLVGEHRQLIREFGGAYSIISGHVDFDGTGLDPRFRYFTVLRDPLERLLSWMDFVLGMPETDDYIRSLKFGARQFLETQGVDTNTTFLTTVRDPYCTRFAGAVTSAPITGIQAREEASRVLRAFDCVGLFEALPEFIAELAPRLGAHAAHDLDHVNRTPLRRERAALGSIFLDRCEALVENDRMLYADARSGALLPAGQRRAQGYGVTPFEWKRPVHPMRPYWQDVGLRLFRGIDLGPGVGEVDGEARENALRQGPIATGPYARLDPGLHEVYLQGRWLTRGSICLIHVMDSREGHVRAMHSLVDDGADDSFRISFKIEIAQTVDEVEVHVQAPAGHNVALDRMAFLGPLELAPCLGGIGPRLEPGDVGYAMGCGILSSGRAGRLCSFVFSSPRRAPPIGGLQLRGLIGPRGLAGAWCVVVDTAGARHTGPLIADVFALEGSQIGLRVASGLLLDFTSIEIYVNAATEVLLGSLDESPSQAPI